MNSIPIFDSLTHPTLNNDWILSGTSKTSNIDILLADMLKYNIKKALAVGILGVGMYDEDHYAEFIRSKTDKLIPIAFLDVNNLKSISETKQKLNKLKMLGYRGIKLHPRIGNFNLTNKLLPYIIKYSNDINLTILLCTYFYDNKINSHLNNTINLIALLENVNDAKLILLHGGGIKLLEFMEIARAFKNILLDLSFTILKYQKSSINSDISFLFSDFDRRICIGSDFPEFNIKDLRLEYNKLSSKISNTKASNIAYKNLLEFLK